MYTGVEDEVPACSVGWVGVGGNGNGNGRRLSAKQAVDGLKEERDIGWASFAAAAAVAAGVSEWGGCATRV